MRRPISPGPLPVFLTLALACCSDSTPSKSNLTRALDANIGQPVCFHIVDTDTPVSWPLKLGEGGLFGTLPPFLGAMERAGYVRVQHTMEQQGPLLIQNIAIVTPTPQAAKWWDSERGWCVGKRTVADVLEWTEPGKETGSPVQVKYTWKLSDVATWALRPEFAGISGLKDPVPATATVRKTNNGWVAE